MSRRLGILLMVGQQVCFTLETSAIHYVGPSLAPMQLAFIRAFGGLLVVLCMLPTVGWAAFSTPQPGLQMFRAGLTIGYLIIMMQAFVAIPLADATAISYSTAIYIILLAPLILGEEVGALRWIAVVIGLVGALLLIQPSFAGSTLIYLGFLAGNSLNALGVVLTKYMQRRDHPITVMLYVNGAATLFFASTLIFEPIPDLSLWQCVWLLPVLIVGPIGMYLGIVALRYADVSTLAPYNYTRLLMIGVIGPILFNEGLSATTVAGAIIIVLACLMANVKQQEVPQPVRAA